MPDGFFSSVFLACLMGLRHGLDADHLAAIDGLSRASANAGRPRLARLSGLLFSLGHGAVVLLAALWLQGRSDRVPPWLDGLGSVLSIALLMLLGLMNLRQALRRNASGAPAPLAAWLLRLGLGRWPGGSVLTGVLFALSFDTFTLAAWFGAVGLVRGGPWAVALIASAFVAGMIACDGLNGLWVAHLIRRSESFAVRARQLFAAAVASTAIAIASFELARLQWQHVDLWFEQRGLWLSACVVGIVILGFYAAVRLSPGTIPMERAGETKEP
jgi:high-affinity nickel-transport protein